MKQVIECLSIIKEIEIDRYELRTLGLTEEEIEGYIELFVDNFFPTLKKGNNKCLN